MKESVLLTTIGGVLSFVLAVLPLITLHEFGHFLVARYFKIPAKQFSIGFGRKILSWRFMNTDFFLRLIPLGGFVEFEKHPQGDYNYRGYPLVALAGPVTNLLIFLVIIFSFSLYAFNSISYYKTSTPLVTTIKGTPVTIPAQEDFIFMPPDSSKNQFLRRQMVRDDQGGAYLFSSTPGAINDSTLTPEQIKNLKLVPKPFSTNLVKSISFSWFFFENGVVMTTKGISELVTNISGFKNFMGPVGIANEANDARKRGLWDFLFLVAGISFALGYINLLPLSFLDGGQFVLSLISRLTKLSPKFLSVYGVFSLLIILGLFSAGLLSDFVRLALGK